MGFKKEKKIVSFNFSLKYCQFSISEVFCSFLKKIQVYLNLSCSWHFTEQMFIYLWFYLYGLEIKIFNDDFSFYLMTSLKRLLILFIMYLYCWQNLLKYFLNLKIIHEKETPLNYPDFKLNLTSHILWLLIMA